MTFRVERIDHVVLRVNDLAAMVRFYEQALGFAVLRRVPEAGLVQMRAGASMLDLVVAERPARGANMDHLCFLVVPFDRPAMEQRLSPFGIALGETVERYGAQGHGMSAYFEDPEGNKIEFKGPSD